MTVAPDGVAAKAPSFWLQGAVLLRHRLLLLSACLLFLTLASSLTLLATARAAHEAIDATKRAAAVQSAYADLFQALGRVGELSFQSESFEVPEPILRQRLIAIVERGMSPLELAVKGQGPRRQRALAEIRALFPAAIDVYTGSPRLLGGIVRQTGQGNDAAVLDEVARIFRPVFVIDDAINAELKVINAEVAETTDRLRGLLVLQAQFGLVSAILAFFCALAIATLIFRRLAPGLRQISQGIEAVIRGDLDARISLGGSDELATTAHAFDRMTAEVAQQRERLHAVNSELEVRVSERTAQLEAANAQLAAEDDRRRAFFAEASHEMRTPLTIIRGDAQVSLRELENDRGDAIGALERILSQTELMSRLTDDLFLIARAEAGGLSLRLSRLDLGQSARATAEALTLLVAERGVRLDVETEPDVHVSADADRMRQIIFALIDNALRHGKGLTVIRICVQRAGEEVLLITEDNGAGAEVSAPNDLLHRFQRAGAVGEGSGLGLSVVRALVHAHNGAVSISTAPGDGFSVTIRLPHQSSREGS